MSATATAVPSSSPGRESGREPALEVRALGFRYGRHVALENVDLLVPRGRFVALLGANGAGKTTLFSIVTGLFAAGDGEVRMLGHRLASDSGRALAALGVVFQRPTLDADLTVRQNLLYFADLHGMRRDVARARVAASLERHRIAPFERRRVATLSGGERRRVELARALLHRPSLLLCDEPTVGLDAPSRADFVRHVRELAAGEGLGVLWATHLFDEVEPHDRVVLLERGRVSATGELAGLLERHRASDAGALFAALATAPPGTSPDAARDLAPNDGTPNDGTSNDGAPSDGSSDEAPDASSGRRSGA